MIRWRRTHIAVVALALAAAGSVAVAEWAVANAPAPADPGAMDSVAHPTVPDGLDGLPVLRTPLRDASGATRSVASLSDAKPVIVNFWSSWCAPCVAEMPLLDKTARERVDVMVVGVNELEDTASAMAMAERTGISYPWLLDSKGALAAEAAIVNLPTTLLVDPAGDVRATRVGAFKSAADLEAWVDSGLR